MTKTAFLLRLQALEPQDDLWVGLHWLIDQNLANDLDALCLPGLDDGEAHRGRGRIGALRDLQAQLNQAMLEAHPNP